jgi:hypothetical protein
VLVCALSPPHQHPRHPVLDRTARRD